MKTPRAPALRVRTESPPDDRFFAIHHHLGGDVVDDLLLFRVSPMPIEVAFGRAADGDAVAGAVADSHLAGRDVDDDAADVPAPRGSRERIRHFIVGQRG